MVLSVIVPDKRPGMQQMLLRELKDIDSEIITKTWQKGLAVATGDYVCLLERDSGISPGALLRQLEPFLNNPRFRKLAMVSPLIEFDDTEPLALSSFGTTDHPQYMQLTRAGCAAGAIIRRSSLTKYNHLLGEHISNFSYKLSTAFWENGLRVMADPLSVYYSPKKARRGTIIEVSSSTLELWKRECIA